MTGLLRRAVRALDRFLTRRMDTVELWDHPDSLFHGELVDADRPLELEDRTLPPGTPVLRLHLRNEEVPEIAAEGPDLAWAALGRRRLLDSLRATARRLRTDPRLAAVQAVGGETVLLSTDTETRDHTLLSRLGFTVRSYGGAGRFGTFWENVYSWMLIWAYNPGTMGSRSFRDLRRAEAWISREGFLDRFLEDDP